MFSSDLSPAELGLCAELGARPLAQVMGACAYTIGVSGAPVLGDPGYREYFGRRRGSGAVMLELRRVSAAYNDVRQTALERIREQAARARAHLVVGVEVRLTESEDTELEMLECVVSGTAVRLERAPSARLPHLTPLSMTDCWCLHQAGYEPVGLAAATAVYYARPSSTTAKALGRPGRSAPPNQELPDLSAATTHARDICQRRMVDQARRQGGRGIIGMSLELNHGLGLGLRGEEAGARSQRYGNLHLTVHGLASVVRPAPGAAAARIRTSPRPVLWLR